MKFDRIYDEVEKIKDYHSLKLLHSLCDYKLCDMKGMYNTTITCPEDVANQLSFLRFEEKEKFVCVTMNSANKIIKIHTITKGLVNQTPVHPRESFIEAIRDQAVSVIFAHNHPSGSTEPSEEDLSITRILCAAGKILQIPVLDHLIVTHRGMTSICRLEPTIFEKSFPDKTKSKIS